MRMLPGNEAGNVGSLPATALVGIFWTVVLRGFELRSFEPRSSGHWTAVVRCFEARSSRLWTAVVGALDRGRQGLWTAAVRGFGPRSSGALDRGRHGLWTAVVRGFGPSQGLWTAVVKGFGLWSSGAFWTVIVSGGGTPPRQMGRG